MRDQSASILYFLHSLYTVHATVNFQVVQQAPQHLMPFKKIIFMAISFTIQSAMKETEKVGRLAINKKDYRMSLKPRGYSYKVNVFAN